jgi:predicted amidohydrolase YtcJ
MTNPLRLFVDEGISMCGGSDSDVTPMDPFLGMSSAVNHPQPGMRLKALESLALFTREAARASFQEGTKGTLEEGKDADMVILDKNPLTANDIGAIRVAMTFVRGKTVYGGNWP